MPLSQTILNSLISISLTELEIYKDVIAKEYAKHKRFFKQNKSFLKNYIIDLEMNFSDFCNIQDICFNLFAKIIYDPTFLADFVHALPFGRLLNHQMLLI